MTLKDYPVEAILEELKERIKMGTRINLDLPGGNIDIDRFGQISMSIDTEAGTITGSVDADRVTGSGYDAVYLSFTPAVEDTEMFDLVNCRVWSGATETTEVVQSGLFDLIGPKGVAEMFDHSGPGKGISEKVTLKRVFLKMR